MAHIENNTGNCTCSAGISVLGTAATYTTIDTGGTWTSGGWHMPNYTYPGGYHAPKCENCGYCPCCGKSDIPGKLSPVIDSSEN